MARRGDTGIDPGKGEARDSMQGCREEDPEGQTERQTGLESAAETPVARQPGQEPRAGERR